MLADHAYTTYNRFIKADYPRTKPGSSQDFRDALEEIGIKAGKKLFHGRRPNKVFQFEAKKTADGLVKLYGGQPPESCSQWPTLDEFDYLQACIERGEESQLLCRATYALEQSCAFQDVKTIEQDAMEE